MNVCCNCGQFSPSLSFCGRCKKVGRQFVSACWCMRFVITSRFLLHLVLSLLTRSHTLWEEVSTGCMAGPQESVQAPQAQARRGNHSQRSRDTCCFGTAPTRVVPDESLSATMLHSAAFFCEAEFISSVTAGPTVRFIATPYVLTCIAMFAWCGSKKVGFGAHVSMASVICSYSVRRRR